MANQYASRPVGILLVCLFGLAASKLQDLTWVLDENHISTVPVYQTDQYRFRYTHRYIGSYKSLPFVAYNTLSTVEHMGTHIDAPYHVNENGKTMDQVPLQDLIGPLVKIDITEAAALNSDAEVSVQDLEDWEKKHGKIPDRAIVVMYSGWDKYYGNNELYFGIKEGDDNNNHPGFGGDATQFLIDKRNILGIGVDALGCDIGNTTSYPAHKIILGQNKICIENLRSLDKVPESGAKIFALPIMLKNGTGTQARVFAEWDTEESCISVGTTTTTGYMCLIVTALLISLLE